MAVVYNGKVLLDPSEKGTKAFEELTQNVKLTNEGYIKFDKNGKPQKLTKEEKAWRSGYLAAQKDSRKVYNAKHGKKKK